MITTKKISIDGREFTHTSSDTFKIHKVGTDEIYTDAMDINPHEYKETDIPLETPTPTTDDMREALGILGVTI